jgi:hypothetical protein
MKKLIVSIEIKNGYFYDKTDLPKEIIVCSFCTNIDFDNLFWMYQYITQYFRISQNYCNGLFSISKSLYFQKISVLEYCFR